MQTSLIPADDFKGITITVKVVPGSSRTELVGMYGTAYKIRIAAPPERGKANKMLIEFLAEHFRIRRNAIQIISGKTSPLKQVLLRGVSSQDVQSRFK
jgi:uncharacterized protein (TIGR00251 family)